jgi:hypothetical protein
MIKFLLLFIIWLSTVILIITFFMIVSESDE